MSSLSCLPSSPEGFAFVLLPYVYILCIYQLLLSKMTWYTFFVIVCSLEIEPTNFALLTQFSIKSDSCEQFFCSSVSVSGHLVVSHDQTPPEHHPNPQGTPRLKAEPPQCHAGLKWRTICPASDTAHFYRFAVKRTISTHNLANISRPVVFSAAVPDSNMRACLCAHECVAAWLLDLICQNNSPSRVIASQTCGGINLFISFKSVVKVLGSSSL